MLPAIECRARWASAGQALGNPWAIPGRALGKALEQWERLYSCVYVPAVHCQQTAGPPFHSAASVRLRLTLTLLHPTSIPPPSHLHPPSSPHPRLILASSPLAASPIGGSPSPSRPPRPSASPCPAPLAPRPDARRRLRPSPARPPPSPASACLPPSSIAAARRVAARPCPATASSPPPRLRPPSRCRLGPLSTRPPPRCPPLSAASPPMDPVGDQGPSATSPRSFALQHMRPRSSFVGCSRISDYELQGKLGEGTFGYASLPPRRSRPAS